MSSLSEIISKIFKSDAPTATTEAAGRTGGTFFEQAPAATPGAASAPTAPAAASPAPVSPASSEAPAAAPATLRDKLADPAIVDLPKEHFGPQPPADPLLRDKYGIDPNMAPKQPAGVLFNMDRVQAPDDIKTFLDEIGTKYKTEIDDYRRGTQTLNDIEQRALASMMGTTTDGIRELRALKAEDMTTAGFTMMNMAKEIKTLAEKTASVDGSEVDAARLRMAMMDFVTLTMHVKGLQTETARTMSAMRIAKRATAEAGQQVQQVVEMFGGMGVNKRLASMLAGLDPTTPEGLGQFGAMIQKSAHATVGDMLWEAYYASLLSSPQTHVVNMLGSLGAYGAAIPELMTAFAIGNLRNLMMGGEHALYAREVMAFVANSETVTAATGRAWSALKTGEPSDIATKLDPQVYRNATTAENLRYAIDNSVVTKWMTQVAPTLLQDGSWTQKGFDLLADYGLRAPKRVMMSADEFNKGLMYESKMRQFAARLALEEGLTGDAYVARVKDLLASPNELMPGASTEAAGAGLDITFQAPLQGAGAKFQQMIFNEPNINNPVGKFVAQATQAFFMRMNMPFVKTPVNLAKYAMQRSYIPGSDIIVPIPTAILLPSFWQSIGKGGVEADLAMAKMALGTAATYGIFGLSGDFIMGAGPSDPKAAREWRGMGYQPYSVVIPKDSTAGKMIGLEKDVAFSYKRLDPFSMMLGLQADAKDIWGFATNEERNLLAVTFTAAMYRNLNDRTFMQNMGDLFDGIAGLKEGKLGALERHYAQVVAGPVIPSGVAWIGRQLDPENRISRDAGSETSVDLKSMRGERAPLDEGTLEILAFGQQVVNRVKARSPFWNKDLPPALDFYGKELTTPPGPMFDLLPFTTKDLSYSVSDMVKLGLPPTRWSGVRAADMGYDKFTKFIQNVGTKGEFVRLGWAPDMHGRTLLGIPLTPQEHHDYVKTVNALRPSSGGLVSDGRFVLDYTGLTLVDALTHLMQTPDYFDASDSAEPGASGTKIKLVQQVVSDYRHDVEFEHEIGLGGADLMTFLQHAPLQRRVMDARSILISPQKQLEQRGLLK